MAAEDGNSPITEPSLLLVEGRDDELFFRHFAQSNGVHNIEIRGYGGREKLPAALRALASISGFERLERLGVIRDADHSAQSALQSVSSALVNAGLGLPTAADKRPYTSILTMPPNQESGCLETLIWQAIMESNPRLAACVSEFVGCMQLTNQGTRIDKARLHAFIASQGDPSLKLGEATRAGYWSLDHHVFDPVRVFLRQLAT